MSPATYSRYFFQLTQCSFTDYINRLRVEHAQKDLITTGRPLTDIAMEHGFSNSSVFSKIFRQYTKLSPSDFAKNINQVTGKKSPPRPKHPGGIPDSDPLQKPWLAQSTRGKPVSSYAPIFKSSFWIQKNYPFLCEAVGYFLQKIFPCGFGEPTRLISTIWTVFLTFW